MKKGFMVIESTKEHTSMLLNLKCSNHKNLIYS